MGLVARFVLGVTAAAALAGCQAIQGSGPRMDNASSLSKESLPFDVIDLTPQSVVAYRPLPVPERPLSATPAPARFVIGPDDVLKVHIVERYAGGIFATLAQSNTLAVTRRVAPSGTIDVPFAGTVQAAGRDLPQIEADIVARLAGKASDPQVTIELEADRTNTITVAGDVAGPGGCRCWTAYAP